MNDHTVLQKKLLEMHIEALFVLDSRSRLTALNELWDKTKTAPRLYLGKTTDGFVLYKFRYDIPPEIIKEVEKYAANEIQGNKNNEIKYTNEYLKILKSKKYSEEVFYCYKNIPEHCCPVE